MSRTVDHDFVVLAAGILVLFQQITSLCDHWLWRVLLLTWPARQLADLSQVAGLEQRAIRDDQVLGAADPADRQFGVDVDELRQVAVLRGECVVDTVLAGAIPGQCSESARSPG